MVPVTVTGFGKILKVMFNIFECSFSICKMLNPILQIVFTIWHIFIVVNVDILKKNYIHLCPGAAIVD